MVTGNPNKFNEVTGNPNKGIWSQETRFSMATNELSFVVAGNPNRFYGGRDE